MTRTPQRRTIPVLPTIIVALAVATMIALGLWQWERRAEKATLLALFEANRSEASVITLGAGPLPEEQLFRTVTTTCAPVSADRLIAGRGVDGSGRYRILAPCVRPGPATPLWVDLGVTDDAQARLAWGGGTVRGIIVPGPDQPSLVDRFTGGARAAPPMIRMDPPAPALKLSAAPSPGDVPNNHLAYAVQWWLFALAALTIYALALRRR